MPTWIYETTLKEWLREGHSSADLYKLTEKQFKIYFADGCIRKFSQSTNPFKSVLKYGNGGLGCEIIAGLEEISKFFLPVA